MVFVPLQSLRPSVRKWLGFLSEPTQGDSLGRWQRSTIGGLVSQRGRGGHLFDALVTAVGSNVAAPLDATLEQFATAV